jgi:hypothetical protein
MQNEFLHRLLLKAEVLAIGPRPFAHVSSQDRSVLPVALATELDTPRIDCGIHSIVVMIFGAAVLRVAQ